jgi:hypothetical protein
MADLSDPLLALRYVGIRQLPEAGDAGDLRLQQVLEREMSHKHPRRRGWTRRGIRIGGFAVPSVAMRTQRRRRPVVLGGAAVATGIAAAVVSLALSATTNTQKAYALTRDANGSYTLTLQDVATALPLVNAEFAKLGIPARAIPVTADCATQAGGLSLLGPEGVSMSFSVTFSAKAVPAGWTDFIAVEQTPSGVRETIGSSSQPLPACLNSDQAPPTTIDPTTAGDGAN